MTRKHRLACLLLAALPAIFPACASRPRLAEPGVFNRAPDHAAAFTQAELAAFGQRAALRMNLPPFSHTQRDYSQPIRYWIQSPAPAEIVVYVPIRSRDLNYRFKESGYVSRREISFEEDIVFRFDAATGQLKFGPQFPPPWVTGSGGRKVRASANMIDRELF